MSRMLGLKKVRRGALILAAPLLLAACSNDNGQNPMNPAGETAKKIDNLINPIFMIAIAVGVAVIGMTIFIAIRFRDNEGKRNPKQIHGNSVLEIGWTILPAIILAVIAVPTVATIFELSKTPPKAETLQITVVAKQWWWEFQYPKGQEKFGIDTPVVTSTMMHAPVGAKITVREQSDNVLHSFWVPELSGKRDVVPGRTNVLSFSASDKPGVYRGACAEFCGLSHANMKFWVVVQSKADFAEWMANQQEGAAQEYAGKIEELTAKKYQCVNCHVFDATSTPNYGPNLTHFGSREYFAGGMYKTNRANLLRWVKNAPSMIPMESQKCRLPAPATCVGMPSFVTPIKQNGKALPLMTNAEANTIVTYLLGQK
ncbi:MAG: cytochrome c oxidase subunit II [Acidimicrobiia bacterium]|nr:cytochrome c oxidase subunit II [Acidimicrobiia bacterium]